jgi:hypothetical protein
LVSLWLNRSNQEYEISPLLGQMEELSRSFDAFDFCFISRSCNKLAHACACLVDRDNQVVEWPIRPVLVLVSPHSFQNATSALVG